MRVWQQELVMRMQIYAAIMVDGVMWAMGPLLILIACGLISLVVYTYLFVISHLVVSLFSPLWFLMTAAGAWLLFNILFNYYMCVTTPPGYTPDDYTVDADEKGPAPDPRLGEGFSQFCKSCRRGKPERAHHCHVCKKCVLMMDHHCPWMHNCVGYYNYRYFFLFLFYMMLGCLFAAGVATKPFLSTLHLRPAMLNAELVAARSFISFTFVICLSVAMAVGILLTWHVYLVASGQTTIEFYFNRSRSYRMRRRGQLFVNEYDLGMRNNFQQVFGKGRFWFSWMLPTTRKPAGSGLRFPTCRDLGGYGIVGSEHHV